MSHPAGALFVKVMATATLVLLAGCQQLPEKPVNQEPTSTSTPVIEQQAKTCPKAPAAKKIIVRVPVDVRGKRVFGGVEQLHISSLNLRTDARIDTGATSSSLHARDITPFERDGKPWVRFTPGKDAKAQPVELPVVRTVRIKRKDGGSTSRPVVSVRVTIGPVTQRIELNLADRSKFEFPALVGRDFLRDVAIVDVSQKHISVLPAPRIK